MNSKKIIGLIIAVGIGVILLGSLLGGSQDVKLSGAGSSFINPLMSEWATKYDVGDVTVDYASVGSGSGIKFLTNKTVDFGASDAPLSEESFTSLQNAIHIPATVGGIVLAYNIPNLGDGLKMNSSVIAKIYMDQITSWDDVEIKQLNPSLTLPSEKINVVHRSDGSGTTFGFTDYLTRSAGDIWTLGTGKSIDWKAGVGAKGNEGVSAQIKSTEYSIGYTELSYSEANNFDTVAIENQEGEFVPATTAAIQKALDNSAPSLPKGEASWSQVSLVNAPGTGSYAIVSFTYIIVYQDLNQLENRETAQALVDFLWWAVHDGQSYAGDLSYVALSSAVVSINERSLGLLNYNGETLTLPSN